MCPLLPSLHISYRIMRMQEPGCVTQTKITLGEYLKDLRIGKRNPGLMRAVR